MKKDIALLSGLLMLMASLISLPAFAQDDLYYDPATDASVGSSQVNENSVKEENKVTKQYHEDDYYYDDDDYAYEYSSRIRRFHRPVQVVDYYDPFYVDLWNYDPFYLPGASIYIGGYNDYWSWRRWNRWQRYNSWSFYDPYVSFGFNSWGYGWNRPWGYYSAWNNPYVYNNYYYDPYWTWNGYNPYYCPNSAWSNNGYYYNNTGGYATNGGYTPKTYTGARRGGSVVNPGYARFVSNDKVTTATSSRLTPATKGVPIIELQSRPNGRVEPVTKSPGVSDRSSGTSRPTTAPVTSGRDMRPATDARVNNPESTRPTTRPTTEPSRNNRPERAVEPSRPSREVSPNREAPRPSREARPSRPSGNDGGSFDRPSRRAAEPSYDRPSRSSQSNERSFQTPSRSNDSGGRSMDSG